MTRPDDRPPGGRRRRPPPVMWWAALGAAIAVLIVAGYMWAAGDRADPAPAATQSAARAPVRVTVPPPPDDPPPATAPTTTEPPSTAGPRATTPPTAAPGARPAPAPPGARGPVVWVQAGHAEPREPGYRDQTGAGSGPFGSEIAFTTRLTPLVIARLRAAGVDARAVAGMVEPRAAAGAAFVSLHHDAPGGSVAFGHAITGAGENYYRGEGSGTPSPTPYPDSAPHRPATTVDAPVEARSRALAERISARVQGIYTPGNGAGGRFGGVQTREGNPRMMRYYGFYRTNADARVIVEAGAAGADDAFLARTDLIASAVAAGITDHLRDRGLLAG